MEIRNLLLSLRFKDGTNLRKMAFVSLVLPIVVWLSQPVVVREIRVPEVLILVALVQLVLIIGSLYSGVGVVTRGREAVPPLDWWVAALGIAFSGLTVLIVFAGFGLLLLLRLT
jgi:hypothetical protein